MTNDDVQVSNSLVNNEYVQKLFDRVRLLKVSKDMLNNALEDSYSKDEELNELTKEKEEISNKAKERKNFVRSSSEEIANMEQELKETNSKIKEEAKLLSEALELVVLNKIKLNVVDENGKPLNISVRARLKSSKKRNLD